MIDINEVSSKNINLSSFKIKEELHPKFWPKGKLNSRVRLRLMDIADDFIEGIGILELAICGVSLVIILIISSIS